MDDRLGYGVGELTCLQLHDLSGQPPEVVVKPYYRPGNLRPQVEPGRVLAVERDVKQLLTVEDTLNDLKEFRLRFEHDQGYRKHLDQRLTADINHLQELSFVDKNLGRIRGLLRRTKAIA